MIPTPALLLDLDVLESNLRRMQEKADRLGVALRPHLKTHKCVEIAKMQRELGGRGVTVSTLTEAKVFSEHGFEDVTWAFPVIPSRIGEALDLAARIRLGLLVDSPDAVELLESTGARPKVWLKVDCGYHRAGVDPEAASAVDLARRIFESPTLDFAGILTHSGQAYSATSRDDMVRVAERERRVMVALAERLRAAGIDVSEVSVGSTPAMSVVEDLAGVTEARPGNYALYDLDQVALGSCRVTDCAATVLTTVVSSNVLGGSVIDAGALALSKDLGQTTTEAPGYGRVLADDRSGRLGAGVVTLSQEHGIVAGRFEVGEQLRIVPNHSCLTVAQFDEFTVVRGDEVIDRWKIWRLR
jgi:D-serine deaminase-like pyridoxal phosphate-dependent protein